jgi:hypothetical protein
MLHGVGELLLVKGVRTAQNYRAPAGLIIAKRPKSVAKSSIVCLAFSGRTLAYNNQPEATLASLKRPAALVEAAPRFT